MRARSYTFVLGVALAFLCTSNRLGRDAKADGAQRDTPKEVRVCVIDNIDEKQKINIYTFRDKFYDPFVFGC